MKSKKIWLVCFLAIVLAISVVTFVSKGNEDKITTNIKVTKHNPDVPDTTNGTEMNSIDFR